ncbi:hypothetical protein [Tolypothrix sp. VBCCA 56010]
MNRRFNHSTKAIALAFVVKFFKQTRSEEITGEPSTQADEENESESDS